MGLPKALPREEYQIFAVVLFIIINKHYLNKVMKNFLQLH